MNHADKDVGIYASQLYLESLNVLANNVEPARPSCFDDMAEDVPKFLELYCKGDAPLEAALRAATAAHRGRVGCSIGYDEQLAHLIQGGADALLVPSRFEPCGLTQLCALRYGTVPVVARVGGLADTVIDASPVALASGVATGVQFAPVSADMLAAAIRRTATLYRQPAAWQRLQANGMATDVSWRDPARRYAALFAEIAA